MSTIRVDFFGGEKIKIELKNKEFIPFRHFPGVKSGEISKFSRGVPVTSEPKKHAQSTYLRNS